MKAENWTAFVPVRKGSCGLPDKNTRLLCGKPLYRHAVDQAIEAGADRVIVSTNIQEILQLSSEPRIEVLKRDPFLCRSSTQMDAVLLDWIETSVIKGLVVLLQATSPLRGPADIRACLDLFSVGGHDLVMSVTEADRSVLKWGTLDGTCYIPISDPAYCFQNRQGLPPVYRPNGAVYVFDASRFLHERTFPSEEIGMVTMSRERSLDVDHLEDLKQCERYLSS